MMRQRIALVSLLVLVLGGIAALHAVGDQPWTQLSPAATAEDTLAAVLRWAALGLGWWVAATTMLYLSSRLVGATRTATALGGLMLPAARRLVEAALVTSLTFGRVTPAVAEQAIPPVILIDRDTAGDSTRAAETQVLPPVVAPPRRGAGDEPHPTHPARGTHVVRPGEHLWGIAATVVGDGPPDELARYWRTLVAHNRDRLRSGDPDLVFPGEVVELPPR